MKPIYLAILTALLQFASFAQETNKPATPPAPKHPTEFQWRGGDLRNFIQVINDTFGINLQEIATIPADMLAAVSPPKMHLQRPMGSLRFRQVLDLYNSISDHGDSALGHWIIEESTQSGPTPDPSAIVLIRPAATPSSAFQVKAFPIPLIDQDAQKSFQRIRETVENEGMMTGNQLIKSGAIPDYDQLRGSMNFHPETGIMVIAGPKPYIDLTTAIVEAFREKAQHADLHFDTKESQPKK